MTAPILFSCRFLVEATPEQCAAWQLCDPALIELFGDALAHAACTARATGAFPVLDLTAAPPLPPEVQRAVGLAPAPQRAPWKRWLRRWREAIGFAAAGLAVGIALGVWL